MSSFASDASASQSDMPLVNRLRARNVHIYDFKERSNVLGGTFLAQQITNSKFYALLDMFIVSSGDLPAYFLQTEDGIKIERNSDFFEPGDYYLDVAGECAPTHN